MSDQAVILLIEDSEDDVFLARRAFNRAALLNPLHVVSTGEEALAYLRGEGIYAIRSEYPLPGLILLDLDMPTMDGFEVIQWIRAEPGLSSTVVVVLTSSADMSDINRAHQLGANSFLVKPLHFGDFVELSRMLRDYWMYTVKAPETFRPPSSTS
jgi:CheY-like chemotaxis protein